MNIRKFLININNKLSLSWRRVDFTASNQRIDAGWYITEFCVAGAVTQTPRVIVSGDDGKDVDRRFTGFHAGRNRMLVYLTGGRLKAYSRSIEFTLLARVTTLEGRARVLLICFRYLVDFFSFRVLFRMIAMQFQNQFELSSDLLQFYSPASESYLANVQKWEKFRGFEKPLTWWTRSIRVAVLIEDESQRTGLDELLVKPDAILKVGDSIPSGIDYVLPLSSTESLREPALLIIKRAIIKSTIKPNLVYTDHDYIVGGLEPGEAGSHYPMDPVFKPQPSQAYLHCFNYIGPAVVFKADLVGAENLSDLFDTSGRYVLALKCFADTRKVLHISEALFCSRDCDPLQTPPPISDQSPWSHIKWQRRREHNVLVADAGFDGWPSVDLIIPTRDGLAVLKPCVESLLNNTSYPDFKIIIVDNGSELEETHAYLAKVSEDPRVVVLPYPGEFNYSAINNFAASHGSSDYIGLVNNDIEVIHDDWLHQMMAWALQPNVGIVGAKLLFGNGKVQHAGVTVGMGNAAGHLHRMEDGDAPGYQNRCVATQNMMAVTAACLITPRFVFEDLGGLNETDFKVAYNDIDYCLRVEATGQQVIWTPEARLFHHESVSRGDDMSERHIKRYFDELGMLQKRWKTKGFVDKYYSRHLRISDEGVYPQIDRGEDDELHFL